MPNTQEIDLKETVREEYLYSTAKELSQKYKLPLSTIKFWVKGVKKDKVSSKQSTEIVLSEAEQEIYDIAIQPEGISARKEIAILNRHFGYEIDKETTEFISLWDQDTKKNIRKKLRKKAQREGTICSFVPQFINVKYPQHCWDNLHKLSEEFYARLCEMTDEYLVLHDLPVTSRRSTMTAVLELSVPFLIDRSAKTLDDRIRNLIKGIEYKQGVSTEAPKGYEEVVYLTPEQMNVYDALEKEALDIL